MAANGVDVDAGRAAAGFSYFEPATNRGELAVWTAGRYELELVATPDGWRYRNFRIEPRLAAPYDEGWATHRIGVSLHDAQCMTARV